MAVSQFKTTSSEWALGLAARAWRFGDLESACARVGPAWEETLTDQATEHCVQYAADRAPSGSSAGIPDIATNASTLGGDIEAMVVLREAHEFQRVCDLDRVHDSWVVRALQAETTAVRRVALESLPEQRKERLCAQLGLEWAEVSTEIPAHPEVSRWVRIAWTERLVGDQPLGPNEPKFLHVLTTWSSRKLAKLLFRIGLAKCSYAAHGLGERSGRLAVEPQEVELVAVFRDSWGERCAALEQVAIGDLAPLVGNSREQIARLGLITVARLLRCVSARRARWVLQHLPYHIAKLVRPHMTPGVSAAPEASLAAWEERVFELSLQSVQPDDSADGETR